MEQGDHCIVLLQRWGEVACCCPARRLPSRSSWLLEEETAGCGSAGRWRQDSLAAAGFCISRGKWKSRGRDVGSVVSSDCMPIFKEGEGEENGDLCLKISQSLGLCVTHSRLFFSKSVSLAPGCFQPHSLLWDLSLLGPWLQQRLFCTFISKMPFCF